MTTVHHRVGNTVVRVAASRLNRAAVGLILLALAAALVAPTAAGAQERTLHVPGDHATVQDAVDAAEPGDLILVAPGTYEESVEVTSDKPGITIRGLERNEVVLDGGYEMGNAITVRADGVALENMTATAYTGNGFYWTSVEGFEGRYLTAWNIGLYGIYAFDSTDGLFEHSYASGSGDASFYIGQCHPCDAEIRDVIGEYSALGYSGTNSGGNLVIRDSLWQLNGAGILPNSLDSQANPPQRGMTVVDNVIRDNGNEETPAAGLSGAVMGHGVGIAGGVENVVEANTITGNSKWGVVIFPLPDDDVYMPADNEIRGNEVTGNGDASPNGADLAIAAGSGTGNCFEDNDFGTSRPPAIEDAYPCDGTGLNELDAIGDSGVAAELAADYAAAESGVDDRPSYEDMPAPDPQPNMPGVGEEDVDPAVDDGDTDPSAAGAMPATGGGLSVVALTALGLALLGSAALGGRRRRVSP